MANAYMKNLPEFGGKRAGNGEATVGNFLEDGHNTGKTMTYQSVTNKTIILTVAALIAATLGYALPILGLPAGIAVIVFSLISIFRRKPISPALAFIMSALMGILAGAITGFMEPQYPGIALQALTGTAITVIVMASLFKFANFRAKGKMLKFWFIAVISYAAFSLVSFIIALTGIMPDGGGLREIQIFGIPLGLIIGPFVILLAAYSLIVDFTYIEDAVANRQDGYYSWTASFSLVSTVIWVYIEILRLLSYIRN